MTEQRDGSGRAVTGLRHFLAGVLDLRFQKNLTMQLLPLFYAMLLLGAAGIAVLVVAAAFWLSPWAGLLTALVAPFGFLAAVAVIRSALEYLVMAYRIMETVNRMDRIAAQVDNLNAQVSTITSGFGQIAGEVTQLRGQFDEVSATVGLLRPLLHSLSLPARLARSYGKRE